MGLGVLTIEQCRQHLDSRLGDAPGGVGEQGACASGRGGCRRCHGPEYARGSIVVDAEGVRWTGDKDPIFYCNYVATKRILLL